MLLQLAMKMGVLWVYGVNAPWAINMTGCSNVLKAPAIAVGIATHGIRITSPVYRGYVSLPLIVRHGYGQMTFTGCLRYMKVMNLGEGLMTG